MLVGKGHNVMEAFNSWLLQMIKVGGPTLCAAYLLFQFLGQKFVEGRLNKQLEDFKAQRNRELETHKSEQQKEWNTYARSCPVGLAKSTKRNSRSYPKHGS